MAQQNLLRDEDVSGWPTAYTYNLDGTVATITATGYINGNGVQAVRTFGYVGGNLTSDSGWIKQ